MDQRLNHLESRTMSIDENIASIMAFWKITPPNKRKAPVRQISDSTQPMITEEVEDAARLFDSSSLGQRDNSTCS